MRTPGGLFVTGNDTDVGKTYVAAMIARAVAAQRIAGGNLQAGGQRLPTARRRTAFGRCANAVAGRRFAGRIGARLPAAICRAAGAAFGGP